MSKKIAIIGDQFMLSEMFAEAIVEACGGQHELRSMSNGWPDENMEHGYAKAGMDGLKEYLGDPDQICEFIGDAEILVTHLAPMSSAMMSRLPSLKMIAVSRGGPVNIDMQAAREHDITVVNAPGRNASAVAEFTIGAILAESRRMRLGHETLRQGQWRGDLYRADRTGREMHEMTIGVVGYGQIGTLLVPLLQAFGSKVLVHDPYVDLHDDHRSAGAEQVSFDQLLTESDVVTLHAGVSDETTHMINTKTLAKMKADAILVNTARGPLVNYPDLYNALKTEQIAGAMLETFDVEPVPEETPLLALPNVTLTPHIAGASVYTVRKACAMAAEEIRRYLNDEPPLNRCL